MPVRDTALTAEIDRLRAALAQEERDAAAREQQLQRYAADLRESFKRERAQAEELARSYKATVQAPSRPGTHTRASTRSE